VLTSWSVVPTCLPAVLRACASCPSGRFAASGAFRVNAHHKSLDAWLLVLCAGCGRTAKLTVVERANVRAVSPALLDRLHANDPALVSELLRSPDLLRRNRVRLDWTGAWRLDAPLPPDAPSLRDGGTLDVEVRFAAQVPVRPTRLIALGLGVTGGEVRRLVAAGALVSSSRLTGTLANDFAFTLRGGPPTAVDPADSRST